MFSGDRVFSRGRRVLVGTPASSSASFDGLKSLDYATRASRLFKDGQIISVVCAGEMGVSESVREGILKESGLCKLLKLKV